MATLKLAIDARRLIHEARTATAAIKGIKHSAETTFNAVKRAASLALGPLKAVVAVSASLKATMIASGLASIKAAADYEMFNQQLRTVVASKKEADRAFKESIEFSVATPFTPEDIIRTRVALESVGVRGKKAVEDVASAAAAMNRQIGDVASAVKSLETQSLRRLGIQLKRQGEEFIFQYRDKIGQAQAITVRGFEEAQQALLDIFGTKFEGGLEKMSLTMKGLVSTLKGAVQDLRAEFGEGFLEESKLIVNDIIEGAKTLKQYAKEAGQNFGDEMMHARASILSAFDVALQMAGQIKEAMKQEGGIGEVILAALELGATLLGKAVFTAFEISLPLWKTIGVILGQGVLNALYQSGLPFSDKLRGRAIEKNLNTKSLDELNTIAKQLGVALDTPVYGPREQRGRIMSISGYNIQEYKGTLGQHKELLADELAEQITKKLSVEDQLQYAEFDPALSIAKSFQSSRDTLVREVKGLGTDATAALQEFENKIAQASGQEPVDIVAEYNESFDKHLKEGEELIAKWRDVLNSDKSSSAGQVAGSGDTAVLSANETKIQQMFTTLELERSLIGKTNDERERAIEMSKLQSLAEEEYGKDAEKTIEVLNRYEKELKQLQKARELQEIADGIGDSFGRAFEDMVLGAKSASEAVKALAQDVARLVMRQMATQPIANAISAGASSLFSGFGFGGGSIAPGPTPGIGTPTAAGTMYAAMGAVFERGALVPMAYGGIVGSPTYFPMSGGRTGLMGEAGPEAVMPLARTADGRLGVASSGGGESNIEVVVNVVNESGRPMGAKQGGTRFNGKQLITEVVLNDIHGYGPIRNAIQGIK